MKSVKELLAMHPRQLDNEYSRVTGNHIQKWTACPPCGNAHLHVMTSEGEVVVCGKTSDDCLIKAIIMFARNHNNC